MMEIHTDKKKEFKQRAAGAVAEFGRFLISNHEQIVGKVDGISAINISMSISGEGFTLPTIKISHVYANKRINEEFIGIEPSSDAAVLMQTEMGNG